MTITAGMVKDLRERTGAGMMECKKALVNANGDIEKAIEDMRKSGQAKADKKASRVAAEGIISIVHNDDNKKAVMIEANCETDFVARDQGFLNFVQISSDVALSNDIDNTESLLSTDSGNGTTIDELRRELISKIGENITLRRLTTLTSKSNTVGQVGSYVHGNRIGVLIEMEGGTLALAKDVAMHIAASNPIVVSPDDVPVDKVEKEKEIFAAQAKQSGKPDEIIEKMIVGRVKKYLDEVSLLGQPFVKDPNITVGKLLKSENAKVISFIRYQVGEGIEKKQDNFADEVMAQVKGSN